VIIMTTGERIKCLQEERRVSNKDLAALLHVANNTISGYVNDKSEMTFDALCRLADYFQVTTDYLLCRTDQPELPLRLTARERELVERFRALGRDQKEVVAHTVRLMQEQNQR
jgi:transcriptional regulator with XRE-family HTH domain